VRRAGDVDGDDDEPLPAGYGVRSPSRPAADAGRGENARGEVTDSGSGSRSSDERDGGEAGGRRRRRRRRGEGRGREGRGSDAAPGSSREGTGSRRSTDAGGVRRGRSRRRSNGEERRSASTFERGRPNEFAPVAGGREEDDEGLEFLGIEDAGHEGPVRDDRHPAMDDDSVIESGLNEVLDVPSWVEAIGIVIAGNLDARSRPPRGDGGRSAESRGDQPPRGGDRSRDDGPRDSRRGGRSGGGQR